jgi:hypothetical protein
MKNILFLFFSLNFLLSTSLLAECLHIYNSEPSIIPPIQISPNLSIEFADNTIPGNKGYYKRAVELITVSYSKDKSYKTNKVFLKTLKNINQSLLKAQKEPITAEKLVELIIEANEKNEFCPNEIPKNLNGIKRVLKRKLGLEVFEPQI